MYKVTIDLPNLAEGGELLIEGLGVFKNGDTELSDETVSFYEQQRVGHEEAYAPQVDEDGNEVLDDAGNPVLVVVGMSQTHPTISELLNNLQGFSVERVSDDSGEELPEPAGEELSVNPVVATDLQLSFTGEADTKNEVNAND